MLANRTYAEPYSYMLSVLRRTETAIKQMATTNCSIEIAATSNDLNPDEFKRAVERWTAEFDDRTQDEKSLFSLYTNETITKAMYNNLKNHYTSLDDFAKMTTIEFCQALRQKHLAISSILKLIDILLDNNILFKDCKSKDEMIYTKKLLETTQ